MYSIQVREHMMIAHSLRGEVFGPAQRLHGATYVVDLELSRPDVSTDGVVADIGRAQQALHETLAPLAYQNLDELPIFEGENTTTEYLARHVFNEVRRRWKGGELGPGSEGLTRMKVTLNESHVANASYEASLEPS